MKSIEAKVVLLGAQAVGKTSICVRYVSNVFNKMVSPTIGASFFTCKISVDGTRVKLQIWDTAGQERFRSMTPMYYRNANAAILVYDITSRESFNELKSWAEELKQNIEDSVVICLLGNKTDLLEQREIDKAEAQLYADSIDAIFYECSALLDQGIQEAFLKLALRLIEHYQRREPSPSPTVSEIGITNTSSSSNKTKCPCLI